MGNHFPAAGKHSMMKASQLNTNKQDTTQDIDLSAPLALVATVGLLVLAALGTRWIEEATSDPRPFTLFFLVPVAFAAAFFGVRGGIFTAITSLVIARLFLFPLESDFLFKNVSNNIEIIALAFGTLTIAFVTGRLRAVLGSLRKANADLTDSESRRQKFSSEVLLAVTGGVLRLCSDDEIRSMIPPHPNLCTALNTTSDAAILRHLLLDEITNRNISTIRTDDLCTAATEAAANAVKHGNGGKASVWFQPDRVQVLIEDEGPGISPAELARATLERGYSTRVSLGMGYYMMIECVDSLALCTSPAGTSIFLTVGGSRKSTIEENILAHYAMS